jgi:hypothetical protein
LGELYIVVSGDQKLGLVVEEGVKIWADLRLFSSSFVVGLLHSSWSGWLVAQGWLSIVLAARSSLDLVFFCYSDISVYVRLFSHKLL